MITKLIDNAKRQFEVDLTNEINYIKKMMNVKENGYPLFWLLLHPNFNRKNINKTLKCPMNYLYSLKLPRFRSELSTIPTQDFFIKHEVPKREWRRNQKVEALIDKYSLKLFDYNTSYQNDTKDEYLLLRSDFEDMIEEIRSVYISNSYLPLFSWLINKAITQNTKKGVAEKNKSLLFKTLYDVNKKNFLKCFVEN